MENKVQESRTSEKAKRKATRALPMDTLHLRLWIETKARNFVMV